MSGSENSVPRDMYGHEIYPLGETGFGVSVSFSSEGPETPPKYPFFSIFHESDNFRQSLFSVSLDSDRPYINGEFEKRIAEHFANESWPLAPPSLREVDP